MIGGQQDVADAGGSASAQASRRYDAFVSYSHETDAVLAPVLQTGLEKFAKPWNRARALRIFRDNSTLSAEPALWPSIERALSQSEWFVLIASEAAAKSPWVDREVEWWVRNRSPDRLLIVVTQGVVKWDEHANDFDWVESTALPPSLHGVFGAEPRWVDAGWSAQTDDLSPVDPRLQDVIADISARIRGVPKDDLVGAAVREHRRTRRIVRGVQVGLGTLLLVSIAATVFALIQRSDAVGQANIATSRQVAAVSETEQASNLDVALLLAARAYRTDANPQTRSALLQADLFSPRLVRYLAMPGQVATVAGSGDRSTVVAGLADGRVMRQSLAGGGASVIASLGGNVQSVAVSGDGRVVAAATGSRGVLWRAHAPPFELSCPTDQHPASVGISPLGRTVAVSCEAPASEGVSVELMDGATASLQAVHPLAASDHLAAAALILPSDNSMLIFGVGGPWQWRTLPGWSLTGSSSGGFGAHQGTSGYSSDGGYVTVTNGDPNIPVWPTSVPTSFDPTTAPFTAQAPISGPSALTLSPDGSEVAAADSGTVYVAPVLAAGKQHPSPVELPGNGSVNEQTLETLVNEQTLVFLGDSAHLLSSSGNLVAVWNLNQLDRLAAVRSSIFHYPCNGCPGALTAVSPDGRDVAAVADNGTNVVLQAVDGSHKPRSFAEGNFAGPPVWDGARLLVPVAGNPGPKTTTSTVRSWAAVSSDNAIVAAALTDVGHSVTIVDQYGNVDVEEPDTGQVERRVSGPRDLRQANSLRLDVGMAAIDSRDHLVAIVHNGKAEVYSLGSGEMVRQIPGPNAALVAYAGGRLLVQRSDGSLDVWSRRGTSLERTLPGDGAYNTLYPVGDSQGHLVARQRSDGSIALVDLGSGAQLATLPAPAPASWGLKIGLAFSPDGHSLISVLQTLAYDWSKIITYDLATGTLVHAACATAGRNLTATDWRAYVGSAPPRDLTCR